MRTNATPNIMRSYSLGRTPIRKLSDIAGALEPHPYDSISMANSVSSNFARGTLEGLIFCEYAHPHDAADLSRCIVAIEDFKQSFCNSDPTQVAAGLNRLKVKSKQWNGIIRNYEHIKNVVLTSENNSLIQANLNKAYKDGAFYYLSDKKTESHTFPDYFPNSDLDKKKLEELLLKIERIFVLGTEETFDEKLVTKEDKKDDKSEHTLSLTKPLAPEVLLTFSRHISEDENKQLKNLLSQISIGTKGALEKFRDGLTSLVSQGVNINIASDKKEKVSLGEYIIELFSAKIGKEEGNDLIAAFNFFFKNHGNPHATNENGRTLLHQLIAGRITTSENAQYVKQLDAMKKMIVLMFNYGVNFNAKDVNGDTAHHIAITARTTNEIINYLHEFGCGINIENKGIGAMMQSETPLDQVNRSNNFEAIHLQNQLTKLGALSRNEFIGVVTDSLGNLVSNKEAKIAEYKSRLSSIFSYKDFISMSPFIDFSSQCKGKTRFDYYRELNILFDIFDCNFIKASIQSQLSTVQLKPYLDEVFSIRSRKEQEYLLQLKILQDSENVEAARASVNAAELAKEKKAEMEKKKNEILSESAALASLTTLCKLPFNLSRLGVFNQGINSLLQARPTLASQNRSAFFKEIQGQVNSKIAVGSLKANFGKYEAEFYKHNP